MSRSSGHPAVGVQSDNGAEAHLRPILETQPVVLLRLAKDGVFLAVNESGLAALGAERLDQLLGSSIAALLPAEERAGLNAFVERVVNGHRGSIEVDLTALTGTRHTMQVHAAPHPGAPDGIASVLATLRDVTEARRLEQSLVDAMQRQSEQEAAHEAERSRLISQLEEARQGQTTGKEYASQLADLERRLQEADANRVEATRHHASEMEGLKEALEERTRIVEEQAARLTSNASNESRMSESLADVSGRLKAAEMEAEAVREEFERLQESAGATELEREKLQGLLNDLRAEAERAALASEKAGSQTAAALQEVEQARQELEQARQQALQAQQDAEQARQLAGQSQQECEQARQASLAAHQAAEQAQAQLEETRHQAQQAQQELQDVLSRAQQAQLEAQQTQQEKDQAIQQLQQSHHEAASQMEADITALRTALDEAMAEQGRLFDTINSHETTARNADSRVAELERALADAQNSSSATISDLEAQWATAREAVDAIDKAKQEAEAEFLSRLSALESALAASRVAERESSSRLEALAGIARRIAGEVHDLATVAAPANTITAAEIAAHLERPLGDVLGREVALAVLVAAPDTAVTAPIDRIEHVVVALAVNRGAAMRSGQMTVEIAEVTVDTDAARGRGGMTPGDYALIAMHVSGDGANEDLPGMLFEAADPAIWEQAEPGLSLAHETARGMGGFLWLANEGPSAVVFELYLPRESARGNE